VGSRSNFIQKSSSIITDIVYERLRLKFESNRTFDAVTNRARTKNVYFKNRLKHRPQDGITPNNERLKVHSTYAVHIIWHKT